MIGLIFREIDVPVTDEDMLHTDARIQSLIIGAIAIAILAGLWIII